MNWYLSLPAAESLVPCGGGTHAVRWEAGRLTLPAHQDIEAELVLGALGGDKPACVSIAETWERHASDLAVLMAGPRSAADRTTVTWEQVEEQRKHRSGTGGPGPGAYSSTLTITGGEEFARRAKERFELLELLALGPELQFRLSGAVAAAWAGDERAGERAERGPEVTAALTGRFAPVAAEWLGIDPDAVTIAPHEGPGWGTLSVTGLTGTLPFGWLADVWACGLAVVDGHLVVAVTEPGYPRARVLALPGPGADPVPLEVEAAPAPFLPRWHR
ncbi:MAG: hypothetical protein J2P25_24325 [Nocardiopsaceae bacterium]|nr:hypothetical protein [Nocardiopsaceae bacterium]